jgi:hypothetical protein
MFGIATDPLLTNVDVSFPSKGKELLSALNHRHGCRSVFSQIDV